MEKYDFIMLENDKIVILREDDTRKFYKEKDGKLFRLTKEETEKIEKIFNLINNEDYYSQMIMQLIEENNKIENKEYVIDFLNYLEMLIPGKSINNFYNNIKTLTVKLNLDSDFKNIKLDDPERVKLGGYNVKNNTLTLSPEALNLFWKVSQNNSDPKSFFCNHLNCTLLHEFAHMASSKYDEYSGISHCGFDMYPVASLDDSNRGLTEGMTEVIAMCGVPSTVEMASRYYIETRFINQLIQIIGKEVMVESYFENLGTEKLEQGLNSIILDPKKSKELFRRIDDNFYLKDFPGKQNLLANIQDDLIEYFRQKLINNIKNNKVNKDNIDKVMLNFEAMLITPSDLEIMQKNPTNYIGLEETVNKFYNIKNEIMNMLDQKEQSQESLNISK